MNNNLIGVDGFVRKTDSSLKLVLANDDTSDFEAGTYVFYLTVRNSIPDTSINNDTDLGVVISKVMNIVLASPSVSLECVFSLNQTELNLTPRIYFYDIKLNFPDNSTVSLTHGYGKFEIIADITRGNA